MAFLDTETYLTVRLNPDGEVIGKIGARAEVKGDHKAGKSWDIPLSKELVGLLKKELEKYESSARNAAKAAAFQAYTIGVNRGTIKELEVKQ